MTSPGESISDSERELWDMFRMEAQERVDRMVSGLEPFAEGTGPEEADSLQDALEQIRREAHTVKGAAGLMGQQVLYQLAERLDFTLRAAKQAGVLQPDRASALIAGSNAFAAGVAAASHGEALPNEVGASIDALAEQ